jgi:spermidine synthase
VKIGPEAGSSPGLGRVWVAAVAAGVQALVAQGLLVREDLLLYGGNEVALGAFLSLWLLGIAAGALLVRPFEDRAGSMAVPLLLLQGVLPLLALLLARAARGLSGVPAYEPFPLLSLLLWTVPVALPVGLNTGALVPALAARARQAGGSVTGVYVAEAAGSLLGGLGTTLLLAADLEPATLLLGCAAIGAAGAAFILPHRSRVAAAVLCLALGVAAWHFGPRLGLRLRAASLSALLPGATLVDHAETSSGSLLLADLEAQQVLMADGRILVAFPDPARVERSAGVLAALTGAPRRLLVVGAEAADVMPGVLSLKALESITWILPDPGLRDFLLRHLPGISTDGRLHILAGDPAALWTDLSSQAPFDAVWLMVDTPTSRADDRFVTAENVAALARLLGEDGTIAVPAPGAENYAGPRLRLALGSVVAAVAAAVPAVRLVPGEEALVLGASRRGLLQFEAARLESLYLEMRPETARLDRPGFAGFLDKARVEGADALVADLLQDPRVSPSSLDRPVALFFNLLVRAEQESENLAGLMESLRHRAGILWAPLLVLALFLLGGVALGPTPADAQRSSVFVLLAAGGALGMGLDLLLLHIYQGRFGTLYLEVSWLFGLWMGGLSAGAMLGRRLCRAVGPYLLGFVALAGLTALAVGAGWLQASLIPG